MILKKQSINNYFDKFIQIDDDFHHSFNYYQKIIEKNRVLYNNLFIFNFIEKKKDEN